MVMLQSPWDCSRLTAQYLCDFRDTTGAMCRLGELRRGKTIIPKDYIPKDYDYSS